MPADQTAELQRLANLLVGVTTALGAPGDTLFDDLPHLVGELRERAYDLQIDRDGARAELQMLRRDTQKDYAAIRGKQARDSARIAELDAALDAKKSQHAETFGMLEGAYAEIERMRIALEAAQRPPDGMRDIADNLGFVAMRIVGGLLQTKPARLHLRKDLADAFEELLNSTPIPTQRPPLGYVVGWVTSDGWKFAREYREPIEDRSDADRELTAELARVPGWELLEVREVQP